MNGKIGLAAAMVGGAGYWAFSHLRRRSWIDVRGKVVLITGGSRGLGLATAREFGSRGSIVAICARDEAELNRAHGDLSRRGVQAHTFVCDVTDRNQVSAMVGEILNRLGQIDILVNNAGIIEVAPLSDITIEDFERAMGVMFWGVLHATLSVLPSMRQRGRGSIVNVTSIGGKVSIPHLLPYCCAKFAAVALSEGLRSEVAAWGIRVTTIVPGLMRTGSHLNARFKGKERDEYAWFAMGAATPLVSIASGRAARSILRATIRGQGEKILSVPADVLARLHGLAPGLNGELLKIANYLLPHGEGHSKATRPGHQMEAELESGIWKTITKLGQKAAESLNEIPPDRPEVLTA